MKLTTTIKSLALATCFIAGSSQAVQVVDSITNGDFDSGLTGWTAVGGNIDLTTIDGTFVDLDVVTGKDRNGKDTFSNISMFQNIQTVAKKEYDLTFFFKDTATGNASNGVKVQFGDSAAVVFKDSKATGWVSGTAKFTATGINTVLSFESSGKADGLGIQIDKISLTSAVPEPETYGMLLAGLGLLGFVARRKAA